MSTIPTPALPPCAPYPKHQPHEYRGVCLQCNSNSRAQLLHMLPPLHGVVSDHECPPDVSPAEDPSCAPFPFDDDFEAAMRDFLDSTKGLLDPPGEYPVALTRHRGGLPPIADLYRDVLAAVDPPLAITIDRTQETRMTTPDPNAVALADAAPDNAFRTEDGAVLVRLAAGWLRIKDGYHRVLPLGAVVPGFGTGHNTVPLVPAPEGLCSPACLADPSTVRCAVDILAPAHGTPAALRWAADEVEDLSRQSGREWPDRTQYSAVTLREQADRIEREGARDQRDRERAEQIASEQHPNAGPGFRGVIVDAVLAGIRAGRDDPEAQS